MNNMGNMHADLGVGLFALAGLIAAFGVYWLLSSRRDRAGDEQVRSDWTSLVATNPMPQYDGTEWDWPAGGLAEYFFGGNQEGYQAAVAAYAPAPEYIAPDLFAENEADRYCAAIRARTDAFITAMSQPQPMWAAASR